MFGGTPGSRPDITRLNVPRDRVQRVFGGTPGSRPDITKLNVPRDRVQRVFGGTPGSRPDITKANGCLGVAPQAQGLTLLTQIISGVGVRIREREAPAPAGGPPGQISPSDTTYLVDPASSHMLVSKIKPCMSQYRPIHGETANGSLNQLWFI